VFIYGYLLIFQPNQRLTHSRFYRYRRRLATAAITKTTTIIKPRTAPIVIGVFPLKINELVGA
jgi:hypothetical protein